VALLLGLAALFAAGVWVLLWTAVGKPALTGRPATPPTPSPSVSAPTVPGPPAWTVANTFDAMKIVLAVVGGLGGVVALTVAYRRQHLGEAAEHREEEKENRERTKLFNERFAKAAELLGSDQAAVRLAGVYAVGALADDWSDGRQMCIDVLCAYLRMPYTPPVDQPAEDVPAAPARDPHEERQVRHTVIRLIRDHLRGGTSRSWQGCDLDFTGAVFDGGDFSRAHFAGGTVSFDRVVFSGAVSFREAVFSGGDVGFERTVFSGGHGDFSAAVFSGAAVTFQGAEFADGEVSFEQAAFSAGSVGFARTAFSGGTVFFDQATFSGGDVSFGQAAFTGSEVSFDSVTFSGSRVSFDLVRFSSGNVIFGDARFLAGTVSFGRARFLGGTVDLSHPAAWDVPPTFRLRRSSPEGLLLPEGWSPPP